MILVASYTNVDQMTRAFIQSRKILRLPFSRPVIALRSCVS